MKHVEFSTLKRLTLTRITVHSPDIIVFETATRQFSLHHGQDCCEVVEIEDICGCLDDLIGSPILVAEEVNNTDEMLVLNRIEGIKPRDDSETWTFYKLDTRKGGVTIRWHGSSNGYYSESVNLYETTLEVL